MFPHICVVNKCNGIKLYGSEYCYHHICHYRKGTEYCVNCGVDRYVDDGFCMLHKCCHEECEKVRIDGSEYCERHTCKSPECMNETIMYDTCLRHSCVICYKPIAKGCMYCDVHKCPHPICVNGDKMCERHKCRHKGSSCVNCMIKGSQFCEIHTCHYEGCYKDNVYDDGLCLKHKCKSHDCFAPILYGTNFCHDHICGGCGKEKHRSDVSCGKACPDRVYAQMYLLQEEIPKYLIGTHHVSIRYDEFYVSCVDRDDKHQQQTPMAYRLIKKIDGRNVMVCCHLCQCTYNACEKLGDIETGHCDGDQMLFDAAGW
jgi:hypothetical protein